jgi:hypothetical protein
MTPGSATEKNPGTHKAKGGTARPDKRFSLQPCLSSET